MSRILKAMAMILVIAAVVFAAGCSSPKAPEANNTTPAASSATNVTPAETNATSAASEGTNVTTAAPSETTAPTVMPAVSNATGNETASAVSNATHVSNTVRKQQLAKERIQSASAGNTTQ